MRSSSIAALAFVLLAVPAFAQTPAAAPAPAAPPAPSVSADISTAPAGVYVMDKSHAAIDFRVKHLGFSIYHGRFNDFESKITLDPAAPEKSSVEVTVQITSVDTNNAKLEGEIRDWFKISQYPTATFKSTKLTKKDAKEGVMEGNLTMLGVTKPIKLNVAFIGHGLHPMSKKPAMGFSARGTIKRSDWGVNYGIPMVSDDVRLQIDAEFTKDETPVVPPAPIPPTPASADKK